MGPGCDKFAACSPTLRVTMLDYDSLVLHKITIQGLGPGVIPTARPILQSKHSQRRH